MTLLISDVVSLVHYPSPLSAVQVTWDRNPPIVSVGEDSVNPPRLAVRRLGFSAVDTRVKVIPRGITATGNHTH